MASDESYISDDCDDSQEIMKRLKRPLFRPCENVENVLAHFGITVNIQPTKKMNKRYWKLYTADKQRDILARIEAGYRRVTPSVKLIEIHYEVCPKLKNIHFHALYEAPILFRDDIKAYYKRICCSQDEKTEKPWRYLDVKRMRGGNKEWLIYIRKDIQK